MCFGYPMTPEYLHRAPLYVHLCVRKCIRARTEAFLSRTRRRKKVWGVDRQMSAAELLQLDDRFMGIQSTLLSAFVYI